MMLTTEAKKWLLLVGILFVCLLAFNYFSRPAHDELAYCFMGLHTPFEGFVPRANSLIQLLRQAYSGYFNDMSGRVFVHFLVGCFSGFGLHIFFDFCNAGMFLLFVWMLASEGRVTNLTPGKFLSVFAFAFLFVWSGVTCVRDDAFCINYLWMFSGVIAMMRLWSSVHNWWWMPVFFVFGWSQETFTLPFLFASFSASCIRLITHRKTENFRYQVAAIVVMSAGACFLCFSPSALNRASTMCARNDLISLFVGFMKNWMALFFDIWPAVIFVLLFLIVWSVRRDSWLFYFDSLEWWLFCVGGFGMYTLLGRNGFHIAASTILACAILVLRYRSRLPMLLRGWWKVVQCFALLWFLYAMFFQIVSGRELQEMLDRYKNDAQGITYRKCRSVGLLFNAVNHVHYPRWARMLFRRHSGLSHDPIVLTESLYRTLYQNPTLFFNRARNVAQTRFYYLEDSAVCWVKEGGGSLTKREQEALDEHLEKWRAPPLRTGWRKFLPGRVEQMFPDQNFYFGLPSEVVQVTSKDGRVYTLYGAERKW